MLERVFPRMSFVKKGGRLATLPFPAPRLAVHSTVEDRVDLTNKLGPHPLWEGYARVANYARSTSTMRKPSQVQSSAKLGRFYTSLALAVGNPVVVEIGTAFGVSGMYWLAGIEDGHLYTFEPNARWAAVARTNLAAISSNFTLTVAPFRNASELPDIDIAFIDAIHTRDFVVDEFAQLRPRMKAGGFVVFDDIDFSPDMASCWREIAADPTIEAAATLAGHAGIIEITSGVHGRG